MYAKKIKKKQPYKKIRDTYISKADELKKMIISYDGNQATDTSATFTAYSDHIVISGIAFNVYILSKIYPTVSSSKISRSGSKCFLH